MADSDMKEAILEIERTVKKKVTPEESEQKKGIEEKAAGCSPQQVLEWQPGFFDDEVALQILLPKEKGGYDLNKEALDKIFHHPDVKENPVMVVSVTGPMRSGKSFLLNLLIHYLSSEVKGKFPSEEKVPQYFKLTEDRDKEIKGISVWSQPFLLFKEDQLKVAILLMDTQGAFDENGNAASPDIFAFSTLLSSWLIYNNPGYIGDDRLKNLNIFTKHSSVLNNLTKKNVAEFNERPFQGFCFLQRNWVDEDFYPCGFDGGSKYLDDTLDEDVTVSTQSIIDKREIKISFDEMGCFLLPRPGELVTGEKSEGYELFYKDLEEDFKFHLNEFFFEILHPNNLKPKKLRGTEIKGEDMLNYVQRCHEHIESRAVSIPLTTMEATAKRLMMSLVTEYREQMTQVVKKPLKKEDVQEIHAKWKVKLSKQFDSQRKYVATIYYHIFEKFKHQLVEEIDEHFIYYQEKQLKYELRLQDERETYLFKAIDKFVRDLHNDIPDVKSRKDAIDFIWENIKMDDYYVEFQKLLFEKLQTSEKLFKSLIEEEKKLTASEEALFAENTSQLSDSLAFKHLNELRRKLFQLDDEAFMKDTVSNKRQPMISAQLEKFRADFSKHFPENDDIKNTTEIFETVCHKSFDVILADYDNFLMTKETEFTTYQNELIINYLEFMHKAISDLYVKPSNLRNIHEVFCKQLEDRYHSMRWKPTEISNHYKKIELQRIEDNYKRIVLLMEKRKSVLSE
ncbi:unnamed protein product [Clavelina lepadiformis]|uniref:GB1/RHD3-type G domain-containing protein n=1 Tax=Clavelina lepadiformis TaxID=159417 RepID=A0ABP0FHQ9_CLALP